MWLRGKSQGIADAEKIIELLDRSENAAKDEIQLVEKFTPVVTQHITATMLRDTLSRLAIDAISIVYEATPRPSMYIPPTKTLKKSMN